MREALEEFLGMMDHMVPTCIKCLGALRETEERIHRVSIVFAYDMAYVTFIPLTEPTMCCEFYVEPDMIKESKLFDFAGKVTSDDQFDINWFLEEFVSKMEE